MCHSVCKLLARLILLPMMVAVASCATYKPVDPAFHKVIGKPYTLDSGDRLRVTVFGEQDLTNTYEIDKAGYLSIPLINSVAARGKTTTQVKHAIASRLASGFLRNPDVTVEVAQYRPFFVMGEVGLSGQYVYVPGMTVQNAIAIAGGFSARAEQQDADITRSVNGKIMTGRVPLSDPILPGDTIYVRERLF